MFSILRFHRKNGECLSQVGGGAFLENMDLWPISPDTKNPLTPLLSICNDIFPSPKIPNDFAVTLFSPISLNSHGSYKLHDIRSMALNEGRLDIGFKNSVVALLHKRSSEQKYYENTFFLPESGMSSEKASKEDIDSELRKESGIFKSKIHGQPGWIQDEIFSSPRYGFILQIFEDDLTLVDEKYEGIFNGGAGFMFLNFNIGKINFNENPGFFIVQFT